ncbi:MAG: hypothetical protein IKD59_06235 [Lachnospiraceae bacterium]|nr:hypothetical protein [Lachnospiraceae bacterium]
MKKFHKVGVSSGGDSLLTMLLVLSQSFLPGHAYDWQNVTRPGESSFGTGRLAVRGKMFDGGTFAKCLHEGSNYCSCGAEFVIENPENPVEDAGAADRSNHGAAGLDGNNVADAERDRTSAVGAEQCRTSAADAKHAKKSRPPYADRKRAGADDFRELCRLFGEKFANVKRFALGIETSFAEKSDDNILSYQLINIWCERVWDEDITSFFELVLYKNGTNYDLYWDELPDIRGVRTSGRAKGCNVRMRNLAVLDIVSDGVQDGARFEEVLPSVVRISRIAADQFGTLRFLDVRSWVADQGDGCNVGSQECAQDTSCYTESQECAQDTSCYTGSQECAQDTCCYAESQESGCCAGVQVSAQESGCHAGAQVYEQGPCYYVGVHGEYTEAVIRTYTEEKIRVAWPDPATGEIRHGLFAEAYEAWKKELGGSLRDESENKTGSPHFDRTWAEEAVLVQGLILRTGETLVLSGDAGLPDKFFNYLSRMGRQIVQIR